jgi:hypothetical protein
MHKTFAAAACAAIYTFSSPLFAADATAVFSGAVASTCILTVGSPGLITADAGFTHLDSDNAGGAESTVAALATGAGFKVSALAPTTFTVGNSTNVTFAADYSLTGATAASNVAGATPTTLNAGSTSVSVGLEASKSSGTFPAGVYSAAVTVRCE